MPGHCALCFQGLKCHWTKPWSLSYWADTELSVGQSVDPASPLDLKKSVRVVCIQVPEVLSLFLSPEPPVNKQKTSE